ncbi:hypothetical protein EDD11_003584 [Mortierella claussenii]|nr:hypothetical protein EDD11_003584 [Mortierella claussenii]
MDVDDEEQLLSIASTIATFRQHPTTTDSGSFSAWASGPASTYSNDDSDPDAVVVFDTNVLISHLNFLHLLIQKYGSEPQKNESALPTSTRKPYVIFVVPWVVVQELDGLKSSGGCRGGGEVDVADKARRAIRYLQDELGRPEQSRRLRGQKISEHIEKQEQNDDNILDCCRYFRQLYPNKQDTKINLFSNDRNLCVKALIHEFRTISWNKIPFELGPVSAAILGSGSVNRVEDDHMAIDSDQSSGAVESTRAIRTKSSKSGGEYRLEVNDREIQRIKTSSSKITATPDGMDPKLFELTTHIIKNLRRHLEFTVPDHLMAHYGQDWRKITNFDETRVKEEDAAYDCGRLSQPIMLLMRYWRNVFADLYGTPSQALAVRSRIDNVQAFVKKWSRVETFGLGKVYKKDLTVFLDDVDIILAGLTSKPVPRHAVNFASSPTMEDPG